METMEYIWIKLQVDLGTFCMDSFGSELYI